MKRVQKTRSTSVEPAKKIEKKEPKIKRAISVRVKTSSKTAKEMTNEKSVPMEVDPAPSKTLKRAKVSVDEGKETDSNNNKNHKKIKGSVLPKHDRGVGRPFVCGTGGVGQLGFEAEQRKHPAPIPFFDKKNLKVQEIVAGGMHTIVLTEDGKVYSFGCNDDFALGRHTEEEEENSSPCVVNVPGRVIQISAGDSHSAALTEEGKVYAWGLFRDGNGSIGLTVESKDPQKEPQYISRRLCTTITKIASGAHHLVMLDQDGAVFTFGTGEQGQLGRSFNPSVRITRSNNDAPKNEREFWLTPQAVVLRARIKFSDIYCGCFSTYMKTLKTNDIYVCGLNNFNQLGVQRRGNDGENLLVNKVIKSPGFKGIHCKEISAGEHHCVALSNEGKVYTLGRQEDGRLGLGEGKGDVSFPTLIPELKDHDCIHVACGLSQGYAVANNGRLFSWGFGENFQLGSGTDEDSLVPRKIEGNEKSVKLSDVDIIYVSGGGQHAAMIGIPKSASNGNTKVNDLKKSKTARAKK